MRFLELVALLEQLPLDPDGYQCVPRPLDALLKHTRWRGSERRTTVARAEYSLLAALALSGWAMRQALLEAVTWDRATGRPRATKLDGVYEDAANHLTEAGLWESATEALAGAGQGSGQAPRRPGSRAVIVRLTERGRKVLEQIGLRPVEDEWTRIERLHGGARDGGQMAHTAAICTFTHHARRRGFDTQVCPDMKGVVPVGTSLGLEIPAHPDVALIDPVRKDALRRGAAGRFRHGAEAGGQVAQPVLAARRGGDLRGDAGAGPALRRRGAGDQGQPRPGDRRAQPAGGPPDLVDARVVRAGAVGAVPRGGCR